jgi:histidyl-tRNA synthetase
MAIQKPSIPKGTRDFTPEIMVRRNYIFNTIKSIFELHGFLPIETPAMENLSTLLGKYGEEGDKLLYRILNSGDYLADVDPNLLSKADSGSLSGKICDRGLRYDLTVPFARFVVQHQNEIIFPFKRYQIQPVWRADRPQKGRYREFYQCDADVVGTDSLINELEFFQIIDEVFTKLGVRVLIKINNRKILSGIAEIIGEPEKVTALTVAIDKLEKIGFDNVKNELLENGFSMEKIENLKPIIQLSGSNANKLAELERVLTNSEIGMKGVSELKEMLGLTEVLKNTNEVQLDITLARGLNYYTGAIFEVKARDIEIGSICGGGRYDNLTGIFGLDNVSGVGISFGADRIYDVMQQLDNFPPAVVTGTKVLFVNFGAEELKKCLTLANELRISGISTEVYPESAKLKKQFAYADSRKIPYVAIIGETELKENKVTLKNMINGQQNLISIDDIKTHLVH